MASIKRITIRVRNPHKPSDPGVRLSERPGVYSKMPREWWPRHEFRSNAPDTQRGKAYKAEQAVWNSGLWNDGPMSVEDAVKYLDRVINSRWFKARFPMFRSLEFIGRTGGRICRAGPTLSQVWVIREAITGDLSMTPSGLKHKGAARMILLHELAHAVLPTGTKHHRRWARVYLDLVKRFEPKMKGEMLEHSFRKHRVKFSPCRAYNPELSGNTAALVAHREKLAATKAGA